MAKFLSYVGAKSNHVGADGQCGVIITGHPLAFVKGKQIAVEGISLHLCPLTYPGGAPHGVTPLTSVVKKVLINGKPVITVGAIAGCGAQIIEGEPRVPVNE